MKRLVLFPSLSHEGGLFVCVWVSVCVCGNYAVIVITPIGQLINKKVI